MTRVTKAYTKFFDTAPVVERGSTVIFISIDEKNPAWFFGKAENHIEGYFPHAWFEVNENNSTAKALRDYDATELTVKIGDEINITEEYMGWLLVVRDQSKGWIPEGCVF